MADKKITELTSSPAANQNDLFVIVSNPGTTPITQKITAAKLFETVTYTANSNVSSSVTGIKVTMNAATANLSSDVIAGKFSLVISNTSVVRMGTGAGGSGFYGISIEHSNTVTRLDANSAPHAFINMEESVVTPALSTTYLIDVGRNGTKNVSSNSTAGNTDVMLVTNGGFANTTIAGKLKIRVNGTTYWLMLSANVS